MEKTYPQSRIGFSDFIRGFCLNFWLTNPTSSYLINKDAKFTRRITVGSFLDVYRDSTNIGIWGEVVDLIVDGDKLGDKIHAGNIKQSDIGCEIANSHSTEIQRKTCGIIDA